MHQGFFFGNHHKHAHIVLHNVYYTLVSYGNQKKSCKHIGELDHREISYSILANLSVGYRLQQNSCQLKTNPICVTGNAIHESHCLVQCFVLGYVFKDDSFFISSSKHEICFHVFHPSSLLHLRAQSQGLKGFWCF